MIAIKDLLSEITNRIDTSSCIYPLQKQIILKLLAVIELVLDNDFEGVIKVNKNLLHIEEN